MAEFHDRLDTEVVIPLANCRLNGELSVPAGALGVVLFAHGSGSSRHSPRNQFVARILREHAVGTLLFDLLTPDEEEQDHFTGHLRFDIEFLAQRLLGASHWFQRHWPGVPIAYFGSSTGGGASLVAEAQSDIPIQAIVSRGGRPDLAGPVLVRVRAPTLLIVGAEDADVVELNREALEKLKCQREMRLVPGATHLFEEPGTLAEVAKIAAEWFELHFKTVSNIQRIS
jgi:pimeloyl-ACP methyl ester carboxylesterase